MGIPAIRTGKRAKAAGNLLHVSSYRALNNIHTERWSTVGWKTRKVLPFCTVWSYFADVMFMYEKIPGSPHDKYSCSRRAWEWGYIIANTGPELHGLCRQVVTLYRSFYTGLVQSEPGLAVIKKRWLILAVATIDRFHWRSPLWMKLWGFLTKLQLSGWSKFLDSSELVNCWFNVRLVTKSQMASVLLKTYTIIICPSALPVVLASIT